MTFVQCVSPLCSKVGAMGREKDWPMYGWYVQSSTQNITSFIHSSFFFNFHLNLSLAWSILTWVVFILKLLHFLMFSYNKLKEKEPIVFVDLLSIISLDFLSDIINPLIIISLKPRHGQCILFLKCLLTPTPRTSYININI